MTHNEVSMMSSEEHQEASWTDAAHRLPEERFRVTQAHGVPVIHAEVPGDNVSCALVFRVGYADEEYAMSGVTHLVEHLALFGWATHDSHANGQTDEYFTTFHFNGPHDDAVEFLNSLASALRDLPLIRISQEKQVLRAEWQRRSGHPALVHAAKRHGMQGPGLAAAAEIGLHRIQEADVADWAAHYFTRDNAIAIFTSGELPTDLRLDLPPGRARPLAHRPRALESVPAYFRGQPGMVLLDSEVPRSAASAVLSGVIQRALLRRLRTELGISYNVATDYKPIDDRLARVSVSADAPVEHQRALTDALFELLSGLRGGRFDPADLETERSARLRVHAEGVSFGELISAAIAVMQTRPVPLRDVTNRELNEVGIPDLTAAADLFWDGILAQIPEGGLEEKGLSATRDCSTERLLGEPHPLLTGSGEVLHLAADGVSMHHPDGRVWTAEFSESVGILKYPDGGRRLIAPDGFMVAIEPRVMPTFTDEHLAALDAKIPPAKHIDLPARAPETLPQMPAREVIADVRGFGGWGDALGVICLLVVLVSLWSIASGGEHPIPVIVPVLAMVGFFVFALGSRRFRRFDKILLADKQAIAKERKIRRRNPAA